MQDNTQETNLIVQEDKVLNKIFDQISSMNNIKNYSVFDTSYELRPDLIYYRTKFEEITQVLYEFVSSIGRQHLIVVGPTGSGKTAFVNYVAATIKNKTPTAIKIDYLNCNKCSNSYQILKKIANIKKRIPKDEAHEQFKKKFKKQHNIQKQIIILDELGPLTEDDLFYHISRDVEFVNIQLVMITKTPEFYNSLSENVKSSLMNKIIPFKPYTEKEILDIIQKRAECGLKKYNLGKLETISMLTEETFKSDIRIAIASLFEIFKDDAFDKFKYLDICDLMEKQYVKVINESILSLDQDTLQLLYLSLQHKYSNGLHRAYSELKGWKVSISHIYKLIDKLEKKELIKKTKIRRGSVYLYFFEHEIPDPSLGFIKQLYDQITEKKKDEVPIKTE